jgi:ABC-type dipeptide/oligopeptide/nickel transport system permease component
VTNFFLRRLLAALLLVALVSSGAFVLGHFAGGDATTELFLSGAGAEVVAERRARLGLDQPLARQFGSWLSGLARLDLGTSAIYDRPVSELVAERAANTALLSAAALGLALLVGLPLGVMTGARPRGPVATIVTPISIALVSCPPIIGALALSLLAVRTGWLSITPGSLAVPALALGLPFAAMLERLQSRATADTLAAPNLLAAAARGIPPGRLLWVHAVRQSLRPVLGVLGIIIGALFGGSLAVEYITAWPGLGRLMYDALVSRDLLLVAGCALLGAVCLAAGNLAADLLRAWIDPRVRAE